MVYDDLQCPFCARLNETVIRQAIEHYHDLIRVVYKDYPLSGIHGWATHAAVDANCLAKQDPDGYWRYIDYVHAHYKEFGARPNNLANTFKKLDDLALRHGSARASEFSELSKCIGAQDQSYIKRSVEEAERLNVQSTPTIYVNEERIVGLRPNDWLWAAIDRALAVGNQQSTAPR